MTSVAVVLHLYLSRNRTAAQLAHLRKLLASNTADAEGEEEVEADPRAEQMSSVVAFAPDSAVRVAASAD